MLSTIKLDNQLPANADKIKNGLANWLLPSEFAVAKPPTAQMIPELLSQHMGTALHMH